MPNWIKSRLQLSQMKSAMDSIQHAERVHDLHLWCARASIEIIATFRKRRETLWKNVCVCEREINRWIQRRVDTMRICDSSILNGLFNQLVLLVFNLLVKNTNVQIEKSLSWRTFAFHWELLGKLLFSLQKDYISLYFILQIEWKPQLKFQTHTHTHTLPHLCRFV